MKMDLKGQARDKNCGFVYDCGMHSCKDVCCDLKHSNVCPLDPSLITNCPCGKNIATNRNSCADPIFTCKEKCDKTLICGHQCIAICHGGEW